MISGLRQERTVTKTLPRLKRLRAICALAAALSGSCDWATFPLDTFHAGQTGTIELRAIQTEDGSVAQGTDGVICVARGTTTITMLVDNPQGYVFAEGLIDTENLPQALPEGVTVRARQRADKNAIEIAISGAAEGAEFTLPLRVKTAKEGRILAVRALNIACVNLETGLSTLEVLGYTLNPGWNPNRRDYAVNVPISVVKVRAEALNAGALVSVNGEQRTLSAGEADIVLELGDNTVTVLATAPHGAGSRTYTLKIVRFTAGSSKSIVMFTVPGATVTTRAGDPNKGVINEEAGTIHVTAPYGTDLRGLTPALIHTGASYRPKGAWDFTNPVIYTVRADDTSTKTYAVTVTPARLVSITVVALPDRKIGDTPSLSGAVIHGTDSVGNTGIDLSAECGITIAPGYNFNTPGLKPVRISHPAIALPAAGKVYVLNNAKRITAFTVAVAGATTAAYGSGKGVINEEAGTISVTVPYGTDLRSLSPTVTCSPGADYSHKGARNFSGPDPVVYTVTAEDGSERRYAVTITMEEDDWDEEDQ
jgi:hypothetical protein